MSTRSQHLYEFGPYRLDTAEQLLLRDGKPVSLTPKAFETLVALVERSGHLVEKEELMKLVWSDAFVEESNLTNNVAAIRKLLGQGKSGQSYIETVPKRGYRFTAPVKELPPEALVVEKRTLTRVVTSEIVDDNSSPQTLVGAGEAIERVPVQPARRSAGPWLLIALLAGSLGIAGFFIYRSVASKPARRIESIAVLPFKNESGNRDLEYLSDGVTETLINNLSQLSDLSVKARSSVFRYKDKAIEPTTVAAELSVQAILNGRLVQRGDNLTLYLSLVDGRSGNQIWGEQYDRKLTDLVALQNEIARNVSRKLGARLSGAEEQKVARNYTENAEAYQLYLKGRYQVLKQKRSETQKGIGYFEQAIAVDPSYALAYVGLAEANRALSLSGEMRATEYMPKAKASAQKAIEIDDTLAEAHSALGFIVFWYDWDWNEAEKQCRRALELDPNSADSHLVYAHLLSNTGRHAEALVEAKRARELDPLNLRTNALEGQFLIHAGRSDEALDRLQKTFELDSNYWFAHVFASSAYIEKRMFAEAVAEAQRARDLSEENAQPLAFLGYALAKSGKQAEARAALEELLKRSTDHYVPAYYIAMIYCGLDQRNEAFAWLERAYEQRDPRMVFLKVEPKWNDLRADPRFQSLLRRVGFSS
jgi:TolB-like protein/DNA-binding winged helix-turn-helix (wHTH) protein/Tfp pilus assembly protein PilF